MNPQHLCWIVLALLGIAIAACGGEAIAAPDDDRIQPYAKNPHYWQYNRQPVLLLGGSDDDNLFQWTGPRLIEQLDLLVSVGGNYVRNTMSDRDEGNVYAFKRLDGGTYDLNQWNDEYWNRLDTFLRETSRRRIFVQMEVWDAWDWTDDCGWERHPWNPQCNVNYTADESGLPTSWQFSPHRKDSPFALTTPGLPNQRGGRAVLQYQEAFVTKILEVAEGYDHVLFTIQNETSAPQAWSDYWANFLQQNAVARGRTVLVSDMREEDIKSRDPHRHMIAHPDLYSFIEGSKANRSHRQAHWDRVLLVRQRVIESGYSRPINNTKVMYGPPFRPRTKPEEAELGDKFWRNILGGCAAVRFHRLVNGLALTELAQTHIRSARMFADAMDIFAMAPDQDVLGENRDNNEAFAMVERGKQYAIYFAGLSDADGIVDVDLSTAPGELRVRWLDVAHSMWTKEEAIQGGDTVTLRRPTPGHWAVLIRR